MSIYSIHPGLSIVSRSSRGRPLVRRARAGGVRRVAFLLRQKDSTLFLIICFFYVADNLLRQLCTPRVDVGRPEQSHTVVQGDPDRKPQQQHFVARVKQLAMHHLALVVDSIRR